MNYVDKIVARLDELLLGDSGTDLLRYYALLVLVRGDLTVERDVHEAWAMWRTATKPDHPDLIPFDELPPETQARDTPYAEAIRKVASEIR